VAIATTPVKVLLLHDHIPDHAADHPSDNSTEKGVTRISGGLLGERSHCDDRGRRQEPARSRGSFHRLDAHGILPMTQLSAFHI
jgi:hypothetical protein